MTTERFKQLQAEAERKEKTRVLSVTPLTSEALGELETLEKAGKIKIKRSYAAFKASGEEELNAKSGIEIVESNRIEVAPGLYRVPVPVPSAMQRSRAESFRLLGLTEAEATAAAVIE